MNLLPLSLECRRTRKLHAALQKSPPLCRARLMIKVAIVVACCGLAPAPCIAIAIFPLEKQLRL
jgi:hypothetical protein